MRRRAIVAAGAALSIAFSAAAAGVAGGAAGSDAVSAAYRQRCADPYPPTRDPANPLDLPRPPGPNPLTGARFFVDGPRHGSAAGAIASLLGRYPASYPVDYSWAQFKRDLATGPLLQQLTVSPTLRRKVDLLEKIADQPEPQRFSLYSGGGGPGAIFAQVQKVLCENLTADPGAIPIITTYFLYQAGYCESRAQIIANRGTFERQVDEMVAGIERRPAVMLLEIDAIGSSGCMRATGALPLWERDIRYEVEKVAALPHTVVYVEGGYSDAETPAYTGRALNAVGVRTIRGFFSNDTHNVWTSTEVKWAEKISRLTGGAHFIVNTATNGRGPLLNRDPSRQGNEDLCNAPGRGLGPRPTTNTGFRHVDGFLWTGTPGNSSGSCHGGPPGGVWWLARALGLAARAQGKLGPGYPAGAY